MPKALKQPGGVAAKVETLVKPTIEGLGLRLWDVRYEKEGAEWFLRVYIDRDGPMDTDTCEVASRAIDPLLDEADLIGQSYYLEVGSPGLGRKLTRVEHFEAMMGEKVVAKLFRPDEAGRREVAGALHSFNGETVVLDTGEGEVAVAVEAASAFRLCDDEDLFA